MTDEQEFLKSKEYLAHMKNLSSSICFLFGMFFCWTCWATDKRKQFTSLKEHSVNCQQSRQNHHKHWNDSESSLFRCQSPQRATEVTWHKYIGSEVSSVAQITCKRKCCNLSVYSLFLWIVDVSVGYESEEEEDEECHHNPCSKVCDWNSVKLSRRRLEWK